MELKISLNTNSIRQAIKKLEMEKSFLENLMIPDFLEECCMWFVEKANEYLDRSDIGRNVVEEIQAGWSFQVFTSRGKVKAVITNTADQASFVEFGVGMIGKDIPHPNVPRNYRYNVPSESKLKTREGYPYWVFPVWDEDDVDMHKGYLARNDRVGRIWIITKGSWREMYAFNTLLDLQNDPTILKSLWEKTKKKFWG